MRVIFVGLHNKPHMAPLDSGTKTGKLVDRIIKLLPDTEVVKTNLFNTDHYPMKGEHFDLVSEWYWTNLPDQDDILVLLGQSCQLSYKSNCTHKDNKILKVAHPASKRSHRDMDEYVRKTSELIIELLK